MSLFLGGGNCCGFDERTDVTILPPMWCHVMVPHDGAMWWCHVMVPRDGATWWCHMMVPHDGATWWCHMMVPCDGATWWCHVMVPRDGAMWWCHTPHQQCGGYSGKTLKNKAENTCNLYMDLWHSPRSEMYNLLYICEINTFIFIHFSGQYT